MAVRIASGFRSVILHVCGNAICILLHVCENAICILLIWLCTLRSERRIIILEPASRLPQPWTKRVSSAVKRDGSVRQAVGKVIPEPLWESVGAPRCIILIYFLIEGETTTGPLRVSCAILEFAHQCSRVVALKSAICIHTTC